MVFSDLALMKCLLYTRHYSWCDANLEEKSPDKKPLHLMGRNFITRFCIMLVSVYFSIFWIALFPSMERPIQNYKKIINKNCKILYCDFFRFQTLVIPCQPKTGFNSMRCVLLNISTKWKQHMWLTLLRGHASLNVEWISFHQSAGQLLLTKPRNIVSRRSCTHWVRKGKTVFLQYN